MTSTTSPPPPPAPPVPAHHAERTNRGLWVGVPRSGKDPRIAFSVLLTLYAGIGAFIWTFNRSPLQMLVIVVTGCLLDMLLHFVLRERRLLFPLSAYISCMSLVLLLNYSHDIFVTMVPVYFTIGAKYILTFKGRHKFNPSLLGIVLSLLLAGNLITAAPAYQWGQWWYTSPFLVLAAIALVVFRVNRGWLVASFIVFYLAQTALRAWILRYHLPAEVLFVGTITTPPFFLFTFFMITDPATSPNSRRGQITIAFAIAAVDLYFHTMQSVFTFFYAAAAIGAVRFGFSHAMALYRQGIGPRLREAWSPQWIRAVIVVLGIGAAGGSAYATVIHPHVALTDAGFTLQRLKPADTGIRVTMDPETLNLPDKRVRNVAKWVLSVGSSASAADVDGDGLVDLFLTNPLAKAQDRNTLYRNMGDFRFERVSVPELDALRNDPKEHGLASTGLFIDYDGDGDRDLFVMVAFGDCMLLRNDTQDGKIKFTDVSGQSGVREYTVGASANAIDYNRDGNMDIYLGNILPDQLEGYDGGQRFNFFNLPAAEYPGDRRMFRFMHASWDNATNGGANVMLHNNGDGTFKRIPASKLGMPETHYSISVATGDVNGDGYTDIYSASDFGRDDLYINEGGKTFRRVQGRFYGDIGKDTYKGMNATIADFDRNGWLDTYISNDHHSLQAEGSILWMNKGIKNGTSEHNPPASAKKWPAPKLHDEATGRGALNENRFGWGAETGDLNNDGWLDLVQTNGMVGDRLDEMEDGKADDGCPDYWYVSHKLMQSGPEIHSYSDNWADLRGRCIFPHEKQRIYLNRGADARPQFVDVADITGLHARTQGRGALLADFDNDGWLDVIVTVQDGAPFVYRSAPTKMARDRHWMGITLQGTGETCAIDPFGSQVTVRQRGELPQLQELHAVNGFESQRDPRMHFGLGDKVGGATVPVDVRWCGREVERFNVKPDGYRVLTRGEGAAKPP